MASDMLLYWASGSPPCWRVMICLEEKGLQGYESKFISMENKEHKSEEVLKINPRGQVPTFKHGDIVVNESLAICTYLEESFEGTKMMPDDAKSKAAVLQRIHEIDNFRIKGGEELVKYMMRTKPEDINQELLATKKSNFRDELQLWENYVTQAGASSHLATKDFSMADVAFYPILALFVRLGLNLDSRPNLKRYYETVTQRPSVQATWPPHWKNSPDKDIIADI